MDVENKRAMDRMWQQWVGGQKEQALTWCISF